MNVVKDRGVLASVVFALGLLPLHATAADAVNLEGMWKITAPQSSFKPEGGSIPFTDKGRKRYQENKRLRPRRNSTITISPRRDAPPPVCRD